MPSILITYTISLQWRHNERDGVSNHQPHDCLLKHLFRRRSKKTSKLRATGLCERNSPVTGEFPAQRVSDAENVSIWWRHHVNEIRCSIDVIMKSITFSEVRSFAINMLHCDSIAFTLFKHPNNSYLRWRIITWLCAFCRKLRQFFNGSGLRLGYICPASSNLVCNEGEWVSP